MRDATERLHYRVTTLPGQLLRARRKYLAYLAEAQALGFEDIFTPVDLAVVEKQSCNKK